MSAIVNALDKSVLKSLFKNTASSDDFGDARHESYSEFVVQRNNEKFFTGHA